MDHFGRISDLLMVLGPVLVWLGRWFRKLDKTLEASRVTTNEHLPHIYGRLRVHDEELNLETPEHPPILRVPNGTNGAVAKPAH